MTAAMKQHQPPSEKSAGRATDRLFQFITIFHKISLFIKRDFVIINPLLLLHYNARAVKKILRLKLKLIQTFYNRLLFPLSWDIVRVYFLHLVLFFYGQISIFDSGLLIYYSQKAW